MKRGEGEAARRDLKKVECGRMQEVGNAPRVAFYNLQGEWEVENRGTLPDIEVELDPALWRQGRDPQLEKAVEVVLDALKKNPMPERRRPPYPNYHNHNGK